MSLSVKKTKKCVIYLSIFNRWHFPGENLPTKEIFGGGKKEKNELIVFAIFYLTNWRAGTIFALRSQVKGDFFQLFLYYADKEVRIKLYIISKEKYISNIKKAHIFMFCLWYLAWQLVVPMAKIPNFAFRFQNIRYKACYNTLLYGECMKISKLSLIFVWNARNVFN